MSSTTKQSALPASKTATAYNLTLTIDEESTAWNECNSASDCLSKKALQVEALSCLLGMPDRETLADELVTNALWLLRDLANEINAAAERVGCDFDQLSEQKGRV